MDVLRISASDTYEIRNLVLRPGLPVKTCHFDGDKDEQSFHLGAFVEKRLVSVASFYLENNPTFSDQYQYRLRGMATVPEQRKKGFSEALLRMAYPIIKQNFCSLLWCNARLSAQGFYEKAGFQTHGEIFEIEGIGPHILMSIKI